MSSTHSLSADARAAILGRIEAALALCYHVSARRLKRVPDEYAACFAGLSQAGLVPADLSARLQQMARFRNLLVHVYWARCRCADGADISRYRPTGTTFSK